MNKIYYLALSFLISILISMPSYKDYSEAFINTAEFGNPAVVSIISEKKINNNYHQFFTPFGNQFHDNDFSNRSIGSGVILDAELGYIVTNNHVIDNADDIRVVLFDKTEIDATIIGTDPLSDLAVIQINSNNLKQIKLGKSNDLKVGEWVVAIGSPFGLQLNHTVTAGIVSAVGRTDVISKLNFEDFIQHDAAINPGNSGGALLNLNGELIGINTAIATDGYSRGNAGVGFAIPIDQVNRVTQDLISIGTVSRGWLGVSIQDIDSNMNKFLNLKKQVGVIVSDVFPNSPAQKGGLLAYDVIISVNDKKIDSSSQLKNTISSERPSDTIKIVIIRENIEKELRIKLGERPNQEDLISGNFNSENQYDLLGLEVENHEDGVIIVDVDEENISFIKQKFRTGDIIVAIGKLDISNINNYNRIISNYSIGDIIMLRIIRNGNARYVTYEIS